jgi:hypothetical protein
VLFWSLFPYISRPIPVSPAEQTASPDAANKVRQLANWQKTIKNVRQVVPVLDQITGITKEQREALRRYYSALGAQEGTVLPAFLLPQQAQQTRSDGTPFEWQLARELGYVVSQPAGSQGDPHLDPDAITNVRRFFEQS